MGLEKQKKKKQKKNKQKVEWRERKKTEDQIMSEPDETKAQILIIFHFSSVSGII